MDDPNNARAGDTFAPTADARDFFRSLSQQRLESFVHLSADLRITYISPAAANMLIRQADVALKGRNFPELVTDADARQQLTQGLAGLTQSPHCYHQQIPLPGDDQSDAWGSWSFHGFLDQQNRLAGILAVGRDDNAQRQSADAMRCWSMIYDTSQEGVMITDAQMSIIDVNPAFSVLSGYAREDLVGQKPDIRKSEHHDSRFYRQMWRSIQRTGKWKGEIWNRRKDGSVVPEWLSIAAVFDPETGKRSNFVATFSDMSALREYQERLEHLASHDPLTKLPNRTLFLDRVSQAMHRTDRNAAPFAILHIDLDGFKNVNDSLGHAVGDRVLVAVAGKLRARLRPSDTMARLGSDEFVALLEDCRNPASLNALCGELIELVGQPIEIGEHRIFLGVSIGVALYPSDAHTAPELLGAADSAMTRAKQEGRNTFAFFHAEMTATARRRISLDSRLRRALANDEFSLAYQPKIDLLTQRIVGAEALLRWDNPEQEVIGPDQFIPVAEDNGLIVPIGEWVLRESARIMRGLRQKGLVLSHMAVNISARQIHRGDLVGTVDAILQEFGIAPDEIELEVTETVLIQSPDQAARVLGALRDRGVRLALDDFGTGWSSLGSLKRFPFTTLKIDREFVNGVLDDRNDESIVRAVSALGKSLQLTVVAEGVESAAHADCITGFGCDMAQGYYFSRPVSSQAFEDLLRARSS